MYKNKNLHGESFNFGPNPYNTKSVKELVESMEKHWPGAKHNIIPSSEINSKKEAQLLKLNCDKSYEKLDWIPVLDFEKTIEKTTKWYYAYYSKEELISEISKKDIKEYIDFAIKNKVSWTRNV